MRGHSRLLYSGLFGKRKRHKPEYPEYAEQRKRWRKGEGSPPYPNPFGESRKRWRGGLRRSVSVLVRCSNNINRCIYAKSQTYKIS